MSPVEGVLTREFPERRVATAARAPNGGYKQVAAMTFVDGGEVVIQIAVDVAALAIEAAFSQAVHEHTSAPVLHALVSSVLDEAGYVITECTTGDELHKRFVSLDATAQRQVTRSFGVGLGQPREQFTSGGHG